MAAGCVSPPRAVALAGLAAFGGPFLLGSSVALSIGSGLIAPHIIDMSVLIAALVGAMSWNLLAMRNGWPTSSSHALVGSLIGSAIASGGLEALLPSGLAVVLFGLLAGPAVGFVLGALGSLLLYYAGQRYPRIVRRVANNGQEMTLVFLALGHGSNDAQKAMAVIAMALMTSGPEAGFQLPTWVVLICAAALALGVLAGSARVVRTLGRRLFRVRPLHALASQTAASISVIVGSLLGWPLSTAQVTGSAIVGAGTSHRPAAVRWRIVRMISLAWLVTIPVSAVAAALVYWVLSLLWTK